MKMNTVMIWQQHKEVIFIDKILIDKRNFLKLRLNIKRIWLKQSIRKNSRKIKNWKKNIFINHPRKSMRKILMKHLLTKLEKIK